MINRQFYGGINIDGWVGGWMEGWMVEWMGGIAIHTSIKHFYNISTTLMSCATLTLILECTAHPH